MTSPGGKPVLIGGRPANADMLSIRHRFLFVHIPKTAGNSIQSILRHYSEDEIVVGPYQDGVERFNVRSAVYHTRKHSKLPVYRRELGEELYRGLFKFTCVRNPWQRAISFFFSPHWARAGWDRDEFIRFIPTIKPVASFLSDHETPVQPLAEAVGNMDYLMRFETLETDFSIVCQRIGIPAQPLPVRNQSKSDPYQSYYDAETKAMVAAHFREEIECFGYTFA